MWAGMDPLKTTVRESGMTIARQRKSLQSWMDDACRTFRPEGPCPPPRTQDLIPHGVKKRKSRRDGIQVTLKRAWRIAGAQDNVETRGEGG